jgi:capsular polysaccharide biosynthesis protein
MEEINLKELFDYIKERLLMIIIMVLAVLVIGSVYSVFVKTPMYRSKTSIVLVSDDGQAGTQSTISQSDVQLNKGLVPTYKEIVTSRKIVEKVITNLSIDYTYEELVKMVTVSNNTNTEIIEITVKNADKALAADIANEIRIVFGDEIKNIYQLQNVKTVDKATEAEKPYNINIFKDLVIYLLIGIVVSFGTIFVIYYFDTTIKSADEIEKKLGLPVVGIIPKVKRKDSSK